MYFIDLYQRQTSQNRRTSADPNQIMQFRKMMKVDGKNSENSGDQNKKLGLKRLNQNIGLRRGMAIRSKSTILEQEHTKER